MSRSAGKIWSWGGLLWWWVCAGFYKLQLADASAGPRVVVAATPVVVADESIANDRETLMQDVLPQHPLVHHGPLTEDREEALKLADEFPTLRSWVHPVAGSGELTPDRRTRQFGAFRDHGGWPECGEGHCGVDLDGPRGTPIFSVAWGVVDRIVRNTDRRSGKYVRVAHPDGAFTYYMHLDEIQEGLRRGMEIHAGDTVGTLGRTGIQTSSPHLHFALQVTGDYRSVYVDPLYFLNQAEVYR